MASGDNDARPEDDTEMEDSSLPTAAAGGRGTRAAAAAFELGPDSAATDFTSAVPSPVARILRISQSSAPSSLLPEDAVPRGGRDKVLVFCDAAIDVRPLAFSYPYTPFVRDYVFVDGRVDPALSKGYLLALFEEALDHWLWPRVLRCEDKGSHVVYRLSDGRRLFLFLRVTAEDVVSGTAPAELLDLCRTAAFLFLHSEAPDPRIVLMMRDLERIMGPGRVLAAYEARLRSIDVSHGEGSAKKETKKALKIVRRLSEKVNDYWFDEEGNRFVEFGDGSYRSASDPESQSAAGADH
ncbi:hypothetical protein DFJ74DRAFT_366578 [Hyaloraphidium curvatum]|nr:hypothetical protein DFJ74DRAFT_366578 [Hyaloraphidium curvatum]